MTPEALKTLTSSASDEWSTPQDWFDKFAAEWGPFDLDPCATNENAKARVYFNKADDGLTRSWKARSVFLQSAIQRYSQLDRGRGAGSRVAEL